MWQLHQQLKKTLLPRKADNILPLTHFSSGNQQTDSASRIRVSRSFFSHPNVIENSGGELETPPPHACCLSLASTRLPFRLEAPKLEELYYKKTDAGEMKVAPRTSGEKIHVTHGSSFLLFFRKNNC